MPTHFFKVVLAKRAPGGVHGDQQVALGAFVLPNAPVQPDTPLTAFSVPVESLEEAAGGVKKSPSSERSCSGSYRLRLDAVRRHVQLMPPLRRRTHMRQQPGLCLADIGFPCMQGWNSFQDI